MQTKLRGSVEQSNLKVHTKKQTVAAIGAAIETSMVKKTMTHPPKCECQNCEVSTCPAENEMCPGAQTPFLACPSKCQFALKKQCHYSWKSISALYNALRGLDSGTCLSPNALSCL